MSAPTDPHGSDGGSPVVAVEYVHRDHPPIQVILLAEPYGMMMHYKRAGSQPCTLTDKCPSAWHSIRPRFHGFIPILFRTSTRPEIWEHRILDGSAGFCRKLEGRDVRGERWELSAPTNDQEQHPVISKLLGEVSLAHLPKPCELEDELRRFFNLKVLPPKTVNPIPGRQYLPAWSLPGAVEAPVVRPPFEAPTLEAPVTAPVEVPVDPRIAKAEKLEAGTKRGINATAERLRREAANGFKMPK